MILQVEIVMGLEEEFGLNIEDDNSENITTIQEATDLMQRINPVVLVTRFWFSVLVQLY